MNQYLHLISNTTTPSPYDMWKPSNGNIKPMISHQIALGFYKNLFKKSTELSVETFYKRMANTIEVKPGADIVLNKTLDADLIEGEGYAYGIEVMLNKTTGKNMGSISYTFTRSKRRVDDLYNQTNILPKGYYPSDYDIPHKLTLSYTYKNKKRGMFSANFTYMTGRPISLPDGEYIYFGSLLPYYSGKNQHRLPDYHRLDIAYTLQMKKNPEKRWNGFWVFSLFNVYGRKNVHSMYIARLSGSRNTEARQLSILGSIIPSVSYTFNF